MTNPTRNSHRTKAKNSQAKNNEAKNSQAKNNEVKNNKPKNNEAKNNEAENNEAKNKEDKNSEAKNIKDKNNEAENNEAKNNEAKDEILKNGESEQDKLVTNEAKDEEDICEANNDVVKNDEAGTNTETQNGCAIERSSSSSNEQEKNSNTEAEARSEHTLFDLIGHNVPCLPLELLKRNHPSEEPAPSSANASPRWVLAPLQNPARTDGLNLKHWVRSDDCQGSLCPIARISKKSMRTNADSIVTVYRFAKFNTTSNVFSYSTEEYYHYLRDDGWTKEETDYLFDLINTYDLRFPIVHDRYDFVSSQERSLDDLKARYYSICQKLIQHRPSTSSSTTDEAIKKQSLIQSYSFDKHREIERKKHVKSLLNRTKSQLLEEEFIYVETRRLEQNLLKRIRNRNELMKLIDGCPHNMLNELKFWPVTEQPNQSQQQSRQSNHYHSSGLGPGNSSINPIQLKRNQNNLRRSETREDDVLGGDRPPSKLPGVNIINPEVQLAQDQKNCIYRFDSSNHPSHTAGSIAGGNHYRSVGLRSTRVTLPKTVAASTRISAVMAELKIPSLLNSLPKPLMMPTRENVEIYERLMQAINQLVDLKRIVERVDSDLKTQRKKLDSFINNSNHHQHHSTSISHQPAPDKPNNDLPSYCADIPPIGPSDNATSQNESQKFDLDSVEAGERVNKQESPTLNPFKLNLNRKRSASVSSSCSNNTGGDPAINPSDQSAIASAHLKSRSHFNGRKKLRKN